MRHKVLLLTSSCVAVLLLIAALLLWAGTRYNLNPWHKVGDVIDEYKQVPVYFNGGIKHIDGRQRASDGYNFGLKYQCVEFVKRFYYIHYQHRMPDTFGNAHDFFQPQLKSGEYNRQRGMYQFRNDGRFAIQTDDLIVFRPWLLNPFGHVAIVSEVTAHDIEIVQQNPGVFASSRERIRLSLTEAKQLADSNVIGWLRLPSNMRKPAN